MWGTSERLVFLCFIGHWQYAMKIACLRGHFASYEPKILPLPVEGGNITRSFRKRPMFTTARKAWSLKETGQMRYYRIVSSVEPYRLASAALVWPTCDSLLCAILRCASPPLLSRAEVSTSHRFLRPTVSPLLT